MITQRTRSGGTEKAFAIAGNAMFIMESSDTTSAPAAATHRDIPRMMTRHARSDRWAVLVVGALAGSLVGGVAGFGTGIIMLPLVAWVLGLRSAVPVLTVTMALGNLSRIWWSRGDVDRAVVVRFALGAVPATALGTVL